MIDDTRLKNIEKLLGEIFKILNGKEGLVTEVALLKQQFRDIPSPNMLRFHASVGGGIVAFLALILVSVVKFFGGD